MTNIAIDFSFIHQKKFLNLDDVYSLNKKFDEINSNDSYSSPYNHIVELTSSETYMEPDFKKLSKKIELFFSNNIGLNNLRLSKLWLVTSLNKNTNSLMLPYIPHFDKHRCLKAMVYLHDITESHGPIHLARTRDDVNIEHRRNTLPPDYKALGLNTINKKDIIDNMTPMVGGAGDVVFFDTNTPHNAGIVSKGYQRKVLRFDFDLDGLNAKSSFIKRVLDRLLK